MKPPPGRRALLALAGAPGTAAGVPRPAEASGGAALPEGLIPLPGGGWRLLLAPEALEPTPAQRAALAGIGRQLAAETTGRVTLWAEVSQGEDVSAPRRRALQRARAVRAALVAGGLPETRVDIRPLGHTEARRDVVDILPPGLARP